MCHAKIQLLAFLESQELREGSASGLCNTEELGRDQRLAAELRSSRRQSGPAGEIVVAQAISRSWATPYPCDGGFDPTLYGALITLSWSSPEDEFPFLSKTRVAEDGTLPEVDIMGQGARLGFSVRGRGKLPLHFQQPQLQAWPGRPDGHSHWSAG